MLHPEDWQETVADKFKANRPLGSQWCEDLARKLVYEQCLCDGNAQEIVAFAMSVPGTKAMGIEWPLWIDLKWINSLRHRVQQHLERRRKERKRIYGF